MDAAAANREQWLLLNRRYLIKALEPLWLALERHGNGGEEEWRSPQAIAITHDKGAADRERAAASAAEAVSDQPSALQTLCEAYDLTKFERDTLLLCAGVELDDDFFAACGVAQGLSAGAPPTFGLALAAIPDSHWSALDPQSPLRRAGLIQVLPGASLTQSALRIDERVLHYLTGHSSMDEWLVNRVRAISPPELLPPSQAVVAKHIIEILNAATSEPSPILLSGNDALARRAVAASACETLGITLYEMSAADAPEEAAERELFCRKWERETILGNCALLVTFDDYSELSIESMRAACALLDRLPSLVLMSSRDALPGGRKRSLRLDVPRPTAEEQRMLWQQALGPLAMRLGGRLDTHLDSIVSHFNLGQEGITIASEHALALTESSLLDGHDDQDEDAKEDDADIGDKLWEACRTQARPQLDELAQRIEPRASWDDLVLPESEKQLLRTLAAHKRQQTAIYQRLGFASRDGRGLGVSALFVGSSGTGKTMAAEVVAKELRLDLYRVELGQLIRKSSGEIEKSLRRLFDAAEEGGVVLLFDEAETLFEKRSDSHDSHDRHTNLEVSSLLQRMDAYKGVAILTSNMHSVQGSAFSRRIRFVVHFPFPGLAQRVEIWRRAFPSGTPLEGLDVSKLARLNVAGGHIRNIALGATVLAAEATQPVGMQHLLAAARYEYAKLEKPLSDAEIRGWI